MRKEQSGAPRMCRQCRGNVYLLRETVSIRAIPMDLLAQERIFWGRRRGRRKEYPVSCENPGSAGLYRNDGDTMKGTTSSWDVRGRLERAKELGSVDRKPRHAGLARICAGERSANDRPHCHHNHEASKDLQDNLEARVTSLLAAPEPAARCWAARCS